MIDYASLLKDTSTYQQFKKIGFEKKHGIAVPLFSLKTKESFGVGEFLDLLPLINWVKQLDMQVIQLLPINDTGIDPSPYSAISSCALNPLYLSLHKLPLIEKNRPLLSMLKAKETLNKFSYVNWAEVRKQKMLFLKSYYQWAFTDIEERDEYKVFVEQNPWLLEYALFKSLKEDYHQKGWMELPKPTQTLNSQTIKNLEVQYKGSIQFYTFLQFLCYQQMTECKKYAEANQILLKGDIPILLSRDSADVFFHKHLFHLNLDAGAPPDFYNSQGQNWSFPPSNWEEAEKTGFHWWKRRLQSQEHFFHLYRIDHVVGFYRIWTIAPGHTPLQGAFHPKNLYLWLAQGEKLLRMLVDNSTMLPLAEDLGTVPHYVFPSLKKLGILGTRVVRWMKYYEEDGSFIPTEAYPPLTMTTLSTHDAEPTKLWWIKYPEEAKVFAQFLKIPYTQDLSLKSQEKILSFSHNTSSLFCINPLQEYTSCFQKLSFPNIEEERVNIPGTFASSNWSYRMKPFLEELVSYTPLTSLIKNLF